MSLEKNKHINPPSISVDDFFEILTNNQGLVVFKFGAEWCAPCKKIKEQVYNFFENCSDDITCYDLDIDINDDLYIYLKNKKMISGIPTLLSYRKGNYTFASDDSFSGTNKIQLHNYFKRCNILCKTK